MFVKIYGIVAVIIDVILCVWAVVVNSPIHAILTLVLLPFVFCGLCAVHILFCIIIALVVNQKSTINKPNKFYKFMLDKTLEMVLFILGYKVFESGKDIIPVDHRFLLVSNHLSGFDPLCTIPSIERFGVIFVSKPENKKIPVAGGFIHMCGFLTIDRDSPRNSMRTLHKCVDIVKNNIASVCIYPEGHRSEDGKLQDFKDGVFYVAKKANCPVVVMTVRYEKRKVWGKRVYLDYKAVLQPQSFEELTTHALSDKVREIMLEK